jgi:hypothetical protein
VESIVQVVEHLPTKSESLSSNPNISHKKWVTRKLEVLHLLVSKEDGCVLRAYVSKVNCKEE